MGKELIEYTVSYEIKTEFHTRTGVLTVKANSGKQAIAKVKKIKTKDLENIIELSFEIEQSTDENN